MSTEPDAGPGCLHAGCGTLIGAMVGMGVAGGLRRMFGVSVSGLAMIAFILGFTIAGFVWKDRLWRWLGL